MTESVGRKCISSCPGKSGFPRGNGDELVSNKREDGDSTEKEEEVKEVFNSFVAYGMSVVASKNTTLHSQFLSVDIALYPS